MGEAQYQWSLTNMILRRRCVHALGLSLSWTFGTILLLCKTFRPCQSSPKEIDDDLLADGEQFAIAAGFFRCTTAAPPHVQLVSLPSLARRILNYIDRLTSSASCCDLTGIATIIRLQLARNRFLVLTDPLPVCFLSLPGTTNVRLETKHRASYRSLASDSVPRRIVFASSLFGLLAAYLLLPRRSSSP